MLFNFFGNQPNTAGDQTTAAYHPVKDAMVRQPEGQQEGTMKTEEHTSATPSTRLPSNRAKPRFNGPERLLGGSVTNGGEGEQTTYRRLPIFSGIVIPFSILLAIPGVTGNWNVRAGAGQTITLVLQAHHDPPWLKWTMVVSLILAVIANACLVARFAERRARIMTILAILFLTVHGA